METVQVLLTVLGLYIVARSVCRLVRDARTAPRPDCGVRTYKYKYRRHAGAAALYFLVVAADRETAELLARVFYDKLVADRLADAAGFQPCYPEGTE